MRQNIQNPNYWETIAMRYEQLQQQQSHQNRSNCRSEESRKTQHKTPGLFFIHYKKQGYD